MGIEFGSEGKKAGEWRISTRQALDKIKDVLEDSDMIETNNKRYWDLWKLIEQIEKEL